MIRILNALALIAVISSATWAYSVKYETILVAEKLKKREAELQRERDAIAVLQAEWHLLNRPERLASLAQPEAGMHMLTAKQMIKPGDVPQGTPAQSNGLEALLTGSIPTPEVVRKTPLKAAGTTPQPMPKHGGQTGKSISSPTTAAVKTAPKAPLPLRPLAKSNEPIKLTPPGKVGAAPLPAVAAAPAEPKPSNALTGLLKKLIR